MPTKKIKKVIIKEFTTDTVFLILGREEGDFPNTRFVFPPTRIKFSIYDNRIEFYCMEELNCRGNPHVEIKAIFPLDAIVPLKKITGKYPPKHWEKVEDVTTIEDYFFLHKNNMFQLVLDPKYGWGKIPKFFESLIPGMDRLLLKSNAEYEASLKRSFIGPYIMLSARFGEEEKKFLDIVEVLKGLDFANPPKGASGQIKITSKDKGDKIGEIKPIEKKVELKDFSGYKLPVSEIEVIKGIETLVSSELTISDDQDLHHNVLNIEKDHVIGFQLAGNALTTLPESLFDISTLELLDLQNNHFVVVSELIGNLKSLKTLNLYHNYLKALPKSIGSLKSLESFH